MGHLDSLQERVDDGADQAQKKYEIREGSKIAPIEKERDRGKKGKFASAGYAWKQVLLRLPVDISEKLGVGRRFCLEENPRSGMQASLTRAVVVAGCS